MIGRPHIVIAGDRRAEYYLVLAMKVRRISNANGWQAPIENRRATSYSGLMKIATHPAFRIGFLDAQNNRPLDHDLILQRIKQETPISALKRLGWDGGMFSPGDVSIAQYRYEEGRRAVKELGLKCRAWGHPDYPPAQLLDYIRSRSKGRVQ